MKKPDWTDWICVAALCLLGVVALVYVPLGWSGIAKVFRSEVAAAWVQSVGTVLALILTGGLAWWETRQRRLDEQRSAAVRLQARLHSGYSLQGALSNFLNLYKLDVNDIRKADTIRFHKRLKAAVVSVVSIDLLDMPTFGSLIDLRSLQAIATEIEDFLPDEPGFVIPRATEERLTICGHSLKPILLGLEAELERLAHQ